MSTHTLSVLVENKPGVLARVAGLFSRRGFNIESLAVGPTEHADVSRMTIVVAVDELPLEQVTKQLNKLVNVIKIVELDPQSRSSASCSWSRSGPTRPCAPRCWSRAAVPRQGGRRVAGGADRRGHRHRDKLEALLRMLEPYGVREMVQSGMVAIGRGPRSITATGVR